MASVREIVKNLEKLAPAGTAEMWDNVGLLVGKPDAKVASAVICIDLNARAIAEAKKKKCQLIVNHHPCIFPREAGLSRVTSEGKGMGALVHECIENGIAVISCHTNFDQCALEVPQEVCRGLGLEPMGRLLDDSEVVKLSVFVPRTHLTKVRDAICEAGAGKIGNYDFCTFNVEGQGSFRGLTGSDPFLGKPGRLELAEEARLETVFPKGLQTEVLRALREAHPYEEVAYDLYPVLQRPPSVGLTKGLGYGVVGKYKKPRAFATVAQEIKKLFRVDHFWVSENPPKTVAKVGFVAGKGAGFVEAALAEGCDLFVTGEAGYHKVIKAAAHGMAIIELGHRESELFFPVVMKKWLSNMGVEGVVLETPVQTIF
ncbi:MAG: Nif3-like dinuclear metal center hexameric protein [Bacteriovoracia bacterium]